MSQILLTAAQTAELLPSRPSERGRIPTQEACMLLKAQDENAEIIEKIVAELHDKGGEGIAQAETFIRQYYRQVDPEDLAERTISDLRGAALAHLSFVQEFKTGFPKLRVYNPQIQRDGWE